MSLQPALAVQSCAIREALRRRTAVLLAVTLALLAFFLPRWAASEAGPQDRLELAVAYGAGPPCFLVAIATTLLAAAAVARELESRRLHTLLSKPLATWQLVLGRWGAILALDGAWLAIVLGVLAVHWAPIGTGGDGIASRILTARTSLVPVVEEPDPAALERRIDELAAGESHGPPPAPQRLETLARAHLRARRIAPGAAHDFEFRGISPGASEARQILVRYEVYSGRVLDAAWLDVRWEDPASGRLLAASQAMHGVPRTVALEGAQASADGVLRLRLRNAASSPEGAALVIDPLSIELLCPHGSLAASALRGFLLLLLQLGLIAALGILASCLFTFPTAALAGLFLYLTGLAAGFLRETFAIRAAAGEPETILEWLDHAAARCGELFLGALPDLTRIDVLGRLADGRAITGIELAQEGAALLGKAALALVAGAFLLRRRELSR